MNRKVLLLIKDVEDVREQIQSLLHFFTVRDKLVLALYQPESTEAGWPFKFFDLGWSTLQEPNLSKKLLFSGALKRRSEAKWLESSAFLDLLVVHRTLYDEFVQMPHVSRILEEVNCPIFLMDDHQERFDEIYLSYNGTAPSFDSIKHFTYLFHPHFENSALNLVVKVNDKALNLENCVYDYLRLHKRHFAISRFFEEDFDEGIEKLLDESSSPLLICGGDRHKNLDQFTHYSEHRERPSSLFLL